MIFVYLEESIHHCPVKEYRAFWCWSTTNVVQNKHFVTCLIMAFREMWAGLKKNPGFLFGQIKKNHGILNVFLNCITNGKPFTRRRISRLLISDEQERVRFL